VAQKFNKTTLPLYADSLTTALFELLRVKSGVAFLELAVVKSAGALPGSAKHTAISRTLGKRERNICNDLQLISHT
jgi:hypothetical protein